MKLLVVSIAVLSLATALPQRRVSLKPDEAAEDQVPAEQNYSNYQPQEQSYRQSNKVVEDFRPKVQLETTTFIPILHFDKEQSADGSYKTSYGTGNNINAEEEGSIHLVGENNDIPALEQKGSYSYTAPDGQIITVNYIADENGFRVSGDHIPTPPPVSPEIQKGLDLIYAGIKANAERNALEAKNNPQAAELQAERARQDYNGQYYQQ